MQQIVLKGPAQLMSPIGVAHGPDRLGDPESTQGVGATVSINGWTWRVPRNEVVNVPRGVVEYMRECGFVVDEVEEKSKKGA